MPSLRQRMTTYLRQLSFVHEPSSSPNNAAGAKPERRSVVARSGAASSSSPAGQSSPSKSGAGCIVSQYLEGRLSDDHRSASASDPTAIVHGKEPGQLPDRRLLHARNAQRVTAACTGPDSGLVGVRRSRLHLSAGPEIDFIDTAQDAEDALSVRPSTPPPAKSRFAAGANYRRAISADPNANRLPAEEKIVSEAPPTAAATNNNRPPAAAAESTLAAADLPVIASVPSWRLENDHAYGLSVSLYEQNFVTGERVGEPMADCFGLIVRGQSAIMAMADGVNWGDGARLAARSAIQGCLEYLDTAIFGVSARNQPRFGTRDVFVSLLRSFWQAHSCILEVGGALSTLTACAILPLAPAEADGRDGRASTGDRFVVCACNVGDSFGYVYSKRDGVREFTQGSHDIATMRDMRDALGALGPVQGTQPELGNLTLSMTMVEAGDIVFLTSDGISDNFDPVVGKFAEARPLPQQQQQQQQQQHEAEQKQPVQQLAPKRQNRSTSAIPEGQPTRPSTKPPRLVSQKSEPGRQSPPPPPPQRPNSASTAAAILSPPRNGPSSGRQRPQIMRAHTVIEARSASARKISARLPLVSGPQRHALTLLRLEDLLCYGINGTRHPCPSARKLCHLLVDFARMITAARRGMLEQRDLYYRFVTDAATGQRSETELNRLQQRAARKRVVDGGLFGQLPGKLDHASVVAFTVERLTGEALGEGPSAAATTTAQVRCAAETDF